MGTCASYAFNTKDVLTGPLYAFDPRRTAILLLGGDKTGDNRWYDVHVPKADDIYERYLEQIKTEGLIRDD